MTEHDKAKRSIIPRADAFAAAAHGAIKQVRKYTGEPYVEHPRAVAKILMEYGQDPVIIAASSLHDVVEDVGDHMLPIIRQEFGDEVADLVDELSDKSKPEDGNRAARKEMDRQRLAKASADAQTIKLADLINNTSSIVKHDRGFAKTYLKEKRALLEVLTRGHPGLYQRAWAVLIAAEAALNEMAAAGEADQAVYKAIADRYFGERNAR